MRKSDAQRRRQLKQPATIESPNDVQDRKSCSQEIDLGTHSKQSQSQINRTVEDRVKRLDESSDGKHEQSKTQTNAMVIVLMQEMHKRLTH